MVGWYKGKPVPQKKNMEALLNHEGNIVVLYKRILNNGKFPYAIFVKGNFVADISEYRIAVQTYNNTIREMEAI